MRKFLFGLAVILMGCNMNTPSEAGKANAIQFVREVLGNVENVQSIDVIKEDSVLCDVPLMFLRNDMLKAQNNYLDDSISADSLRSVIDYVSNTHQDIVNSWLYGIVVNDSLKTLPKYKDVWRRLYTVEVTMKSGIKKSARVLMEGNGITPRCLENDFINSMNEYSDDIVNARQSIW